MCVFFFFQAEDGIRDLVRSRGLGDVYKRQVPEYSGVGRPPSRKQPQSGWQYLQVVKHRENGRIIGTELRVIYGDETEAVSYTHLTLPTSDLV